jgi:hypothetical protein
MPVTDAALVELRLRYEAAYNAYHSCVLALEEVWRGGDRPSAELLGRHTMTLRDLNEQRTRYRDALVEVAFLGDEPPH